MLNALFSLDLHDMFVPTHSIAEMFVRGTIMYFLLLALLRFIRNRQSSGLGVTDVLVIVLIADAAQNGMAKEYRSVTEGAALVGTIIGWDYALDWLSYRFPRVQRLLHPSPLMLVSDGKLMRRNLRRQMITTEELMSQLRQQGVGEVAEVRAAFMEGDGRISVIKSDGSSGGRPTDSSGSPDT